MNDPALVTRDYGYWVENELRERFELEGVPVSIDFVTPHVRFLVAGAGSWGTAFTHVLLERGHDVVLGCHTAEQARAIAETGRNPRYLPKVDLRAVEAVAARRRAGATSTSSSSRCRARRSRTSSPRCRATRRC